jgi:hypothetical protein
LRYNLQNSLEEVMRKLFSLICILFLTLSGYGAQLVFKTEKTIQSDGNKFVELITFDSTKYSQIRVGILLGGEKAEEIPNPNQGNELTKLKIADENYIQCEAVENTDKIFIQGFFLQSNRSIIIDTPPNKLRLSANKSGTYKIYIWASE